MCYLCTHTNETREMGAPVELAFCLRTSHHANLPGWSETQQQIHLARWGAKRMECDQLIQSFKLRCAAANGAGTAFSVPQHGLARSPGSSQITTNCLFCTPLEFQALLQNCSQEPATCLPRLPCCDRANATSRSIVPIRQPTQLVTAAQCATPLCCLPPVQRCLPASPATLPRGLEASPTPTPWGSHVSLRRRARCSA